MDMFDIFNRVPEKPNTKKKEAQIEKGNDMSFSILETEYPFKDALITLDGYDLLVTEKDFDERTKKVKELFMSRDIFFPEEVEKRIEKYRKHNLNPQDIKIYEDVKGKKQLEVFFD